MDYCCNRSDDPGFVVIVCVLRNVNFGLEKELNPVSKAQWAILIETWKTVVLKAMWVMEAQLKMFQMGAVLLATGLETIFVMCWQRMWLFLPLS